MREMTLISIWVTQMKELLMLMVNNDILRINLKIISFK